uniref:DUF4806 domain-containing protein n=1 Tax=Strongyloides stercoralis TaxID=6248 RepID=A0A0K0EPA0_STRER
MIRLSSTNEMLKFPLNRSVDPFHDLSEGAVPQITFMILRKAILQKLFTTKVFYNTAIEISKELKNHSKFHDSLNSPEYLISLINNNDVEKKVTLKLNGSQSVALLFFLPIIFDMLCPDNFNLEKQLILKLIEIVKFCTFNSLQKHECDLMDSAIIDFLNLLRKVEPSFSVSIKFHNLCHYKLMAETYGLPKSWSCKREESTNTVLKQLILISKNRVNVPKTCFRKLMQRKNLLDMLIESDPSFNPSVKPPVPLQKKIIKGQNGKIYVIE